MRDPERIPMILAALQRRWEAEPDMRLGQLLVVAFQRSASVEHPPNPLFGVEDGDLLAMLGAETDVEREYIAGERDAAKRGWAEWEKRHRELHPAARQQRLDRRPWFPTVDEVVAINDSIKGHRRRPHEGLVRHAQSPERENPAA